MDPDWVKSNESAMAVVRRVNELLKALGDLKTQLNTMENPSAAKRVLLAEVERGYQQFYNVAHQSVQETHDTYTESNYDAWLEGKRQAASTASMEQGYTLASIEHALSAMRLDDPQTHHFTEFYANLQKTQEIAAVLNETRALLVEAFPELNLESLPRLEVDVTPEDMELVQNMDTHRHALRNKQAELQASAEPMEIETRPVASPMSIPLSGFTIVPSATAPAPAPAPAPALAPAHTPRQPPLHEQKRILRAQLAEVEHKIDTITDTLNSARGWTASLMGGGMTDGEIADKRATLALLQQQHAEVSDQLADLSVQRALDS